MSSENRTTGTTDELWHAPAVGEITVLVVGGAPRPGRGTVSITRFAAVCSALEVMFRRLDGADEGRTVANGTNVGLGECGGGELVLVGGTIEGACDGARVAS